MPPQSARLRPKPITGSGMLPADDEAVLQRPAHLQVAAAAAAESRLTEPSPGHLAAAPADLRGTSIADAGHQDAEPAPAGVLADKTRQLTVLIEFGVRDRFDEYLAGLRPRPTNTVLVNAALQAAVGRFGELIQARKPPAQPGVLFGGPAGGRRRTTTEARRTVQLAFYPTYGEADLLKRIAEENDTSMAAVVEAALDEYLPSAEELAARRQGSGGKERRGQRDLTR